MADEVYYFDGSAGCERCDAMTGYYLDPPLGPHPNCNCPVETVTAEVELEIRDVSYQEGHLHVEVEEGFDNCGNDEESFGSLLLDEDEEESFDAGLREAAEAAGWSEPATEELSVYVPLPANSYGTLKMVVGRYVAEFEGEVWAIHEDGSEQYVGNATGFYEKNIAIEQAEFEGQSCDDRLDRWIPRDDGDSDDSDSDSGDDLIV